VVGTYVEKFTIGASMSDQEYRPRLTLDIPEETLNKLRSLIPWGIRSQLFTVIINDLNDIMEENGAGFVTGALLQRDITLKDIIQIELKED
jgi:hypothetical protein